MTDHGASGWRYVVHGLRVLVNRPLLDLPVVADAGPADVVVTMSIGVRPVDAPRPGEQLHSSPGLAPNGEPFLQVWRRSSDGGIRVRYTDGDNVALFTADRSGARVTVEATDELHVNDVSAYLLGPVVGCVLRLRGTTTLHGGALAVDGRALVVVGPSGAGKSTLVAALAHRGVPVLTDDHVPLVEVDDPADYLVHPGYPRLRVWPTAVRGLQDVQPDALPRVLASQEKRFIGLTDDGGASRWRYHDQPLPIGAIYVLGERHAGEAMSLVAPSHAEAFINLTANTYAPYLVEGAEQTRDFRLLGQLVAQIPVRTVERPDDLGSLPRLCDLIVDDMRTLARR